MNSKQICFYFVWCVLLVGFLSPATQAETYEDVQPPAGLSKKELLNWEVEHIPAESVTVREDGKTIYLNNRFCPLQRRVIQEPLDFISRALPYKGKNPKFKGKTFVFNFCCGVCRQRFAEHFEKFPDEILKHYSIE